MRSAPQGQQPESAWGQTQGPLVVWLEVAHPRDPLFCTSGFTSNLTREGSRILEMGWNPGTCCCSWTWSLRRWISKRCISIILPVSSCSFSLMVGVVPTVSSLGPVRDRAGRMWA